MSENQEKFQSDTITLSKSLVVGVVVGVLALVAGLVGGYFMGQNAAVKTYEVMIADLQEDLSAANAAANQGGAVVPEAAAAQPTPAPALADVTADDDPFLGGEDAPVVLIEFSDFRCGYCQRFYSETLPQLLEKYGDDLKFVYRDFPVVGGAQAAVAAECADQQDKFWEYHNALFENPSAYNAQEDFEALAADLGLDGEAFSACYVNEETMAEVTNDVEDARASGISGTPTFFINGVRIIGARPFDDFVLAIDAALDIAGE